MASLRPGGLELTARALELMKLQKGAKILDAGCGDGTTAEFIKSRYDYTVTGIDNSPALIKQGLERVPSLDLHLKSALDTGFPDGAFDGVMFECTLSVMDDISAALSEAFRILKPGGIISISDVYDTSDDPEGEILFDGAFVKENLFRLLSSWSFDIIAFHDHTKDMRSFYAQIIWNYGSLDEFRKQTTDDGLEECAFCGMKSFKNKGYFLLIAKKGIIT